MANIGFLTRDFENRFTGNIKTLFTQTPLSLVPVTQPGRALITRSHRVMAGNTEIGMALALAPLNGRAYYRVVLDTPEFSAPIIASMIETETAGSFDLVWTRPGHAVSDAPRFR